MTDDFRNRWGELSPGPRFPQNPRDPAVSLYDPATGARRYNFENKPDGAHAIDTRTGEVAFRVDARGNMFLPDGRPLGKAPKVAKRPTPPDPTERLYGQRPTAPKRTTHPPASDAARLAKALYGRR